MSDFVFHDVEQNSEAWFDLRLGKVTNSNAPAFMAAEGRPFGETAQHYALQVALEIVTGRRAEHSFSNRHTERGHAQEPVARMLYEEEHFCTVTNGGFFDCGPHGDSPDGLVGEVGCVEIKSVTAPVHYATLQRARFDPSYQWQLVGHLDCTGRDWVDFVSYCSEFPDDLQLLTYRLHRHEVSDEIRRLRKRRGELLALVRDIVIRLRGDAPAAPSFVPATLLPTSHPAALAVTLPSSIFG